MTLLAGSYDSFIWAFSLKNLIPSSSSSETLTLTPLFSYHSHNSRITSLAAAGPVAASGSHDESIKIYNLTNHSEIDSIFPYSGSITSLAFYTSPLTPSLPRNLIAATGDGNLCIFETHPFVLLQTLRVHRRPISDLAVHPSGRLALTVAQDSCLAMVNLVRGRRSFSCRIDREASIVRYASEERFFMVADERITAHDAEDAKIAQEMVAQKPVLCIAAGESGLLFAAGEDKSIVAWDTTSGKIAYSVPGAHSTRIKGLVVFKSRTDTENLETFDGLASASSDGVMRIWDLRMISKEKAKPLAESNTKSRLNCLAGSSLQ